MNLLERIGTGLAVTPVTLFFPWLAFGIIVEPTSTTVPTWWAVGVVIGVSVSIIGIVLTELARSFE